MITSISHIIETFLIGLHEYKMPWMTNALIVYSIIFASFFIAYSLLKFQRNVSLRTVPPAPPPHHKRTYKQFNGNPLIVPLWQQGGDS